MGLFGRKKHPTPHIAGVVVAAGISHRMAGIDKQQAQVYDLPVVVRSIAQLSSSRQIGEVVVVCRSEQIPAYYNLVRDYGLDKVSSVVGGGTMRQDSVFNGIAACREDTAFFAIHDGARPLVSTQEIDDCIAKAMEYGASAVAVAVKDTIKLCDPQGKVLSTPQRDGVYAVQTPQIFAAPLYRQAMALAKQQGKQYTDDCQLVEQAGHAVYLSPGSYDNIKITTPQDLVLAQAILSMQQGGEPLW